MRGSAADDTLSTISATTSCTSEASVATLGCVLIAAPRPPDTGGVSTLEVEGAIGASDSAKLHRSATLGTQNSPRTIHTIQQVDKHAPASKLHPD